MALAGSDVIKWRATPLLRFYGESVAMMKDASSEVDA
jgi:hypothetical protein